MKTKLTLNINSSVIEKAKKKAANKKTSLSAIVEDYLYQFSDNVSKKITSKKRKTITQRIKEITKPVQISDSELKAAWHKHLDEKYGK
ncbi:MAG: DUF6364 family protein [Parafilimonas sp.]